MALCKITIVNAESLVRYLIFKINSPLIQNDQTHAIDTLLL
jgi:hypothetical protein